MYMIIALCAISAACFGNERRATPPRPILTRSLTRYAEDFPESEEEREAKIKAENARSAPVAIPARRLSTTEEQSVEVELESDDEDPVLLHTPPNRDFPVKIWQIRSQIIQDIINKKANEGKK
jgi:hypothetical protein